MARPKNTKTKKKTAPVKAPASPVTEKVVTAEETTAVTVTAPAAAEPAPVVEAPAAKAKETKTAPKKKDAPAKTKAPKKEVFLIQSNGNDYTMDDIKETCKEAYKSGTRKHVKSIDVYLKAENGGLRAYYVINGKADGSYIVL